METEIKDNVRNTNKRVLEVVNIIGKGKLARIIDESFKTYYKTIYGVEEDLGVQSTSGVYRHGNVEVSVTVFDNQMFLSIFKYDEFWEEGEVILDFDVRRTDGEDSFEGIYSKEDVEIPQFELFITGFNFDEIDDALEGYKKQPKEDKEYFDKVTKSLSEYDKLVVVSDVFK